MDFGQIVGSAFGAPKRWLSRRPFGRLRAGLCRIEARFGAIRGLDTAKAMELGCPTQNIASPTRPTNCAVPYFVQSPNSNGYF